MPPRVRHAAAAAYALAFAFTLAQIYSSRQILFEVFIPLYPSLLCSPKAQLLTYHHLHLSLLSFVV
jgi:hypothetical protein